MGGERQSIELSRISAGHRRALVLCTACCVYSCDSSSARENPAWKGEIRHLPNGAQLVTNPQLGYWPEDQAWHLDETLRVGALTGSGPDVFGRIAALAVDSSGRIFVFDGYARELRAFDASGMMIAKIGRRGQGPGEFESVIGMAISDPEVLWVVDGALARYTLLESSSLAQLALHSRAGAVYKLPWAGAGAADGGLYDTLVLPSEDTEVVLRVTERGAVTDTLPLRTPNIERPRRGSIAFPLPYAAQVLRCVTSEGIIWTSTSHEYRLTKMSGRGDTLLVVTRAHAPMTLSGSERDSIKRYVDRLKAEFGLGIQESMIPISPPVLAWMVADDAGYLWVGRIEKGSIRAIDVFDQSGRFAGTIRLAFDLAPHPVPVIRNRTFYAAIRIESDVPAFIRAAVIGQPAGKVK